MATKKKAAAAVSKPKPKKEKPVSKETEATAVPVPEPQQDDLPNNISELEEMCDKLWLQIVDDTGNKKEKVKLIAQYNKAANKCNKIAGFEVLTIITEKTLSTTIKLPAAPMPDEPQPVKRDGNLQVGDIIKIVFAGGKADVRILEFTGSGDTFKCKGTDGYLYHVSIHDILLPGETPIKYYQRIGKKQKASTTAAPAGKVPGQAKEPRAPKAAAQAARKELKVMKLTPAIKKIVDSDGSGADKIRGVYDLNPGGFDILDFELMSGIEKGRIVGCLKKHLAADVFAKMKR